MSELETLLGRGGSEVRYGNLLLVPIDQALLYVQPFYVVAEGETRQLPLLERVIAVFGDEVVIENTLAEALEALFGQAAATQEEPDADEPPPERRRDAERADDAGTAAEQAGDLLDEADDAVRRGRRRRCEERPRHATRTRSTRPEDKVDEAIDLLGGRRRRRRDPGGAPAGAPPTDDHHHRRRRPPPAPTPA